LAEKFLDAQRSEREEVMGSAFGKIASKSKILTPTPVSTQPAPTTAPTTAPQPAATVPAPVQSPAAPPAAASGLSSIFKSARITSGQGASKSRAFGLMKGLI